MCASYYEHHYGPPYKGTAGKSHLTNASSEMRVQAKHRLLDVDRDRCLMFRSSEGLFVYQALSDLIRDCVQSQSTLNLLLPLKQEALPLAQGPAEVVSPSTRAHGAFLGMIQQPNGVLCWQVFCNN